MGKSAYEIWNILKKRYQDKILHSCEKCLPEVCSAITRQGSTCQHTGQRSIWMWRVKDVLSGQQKKWTKLRRNSKNSKNELCTNKKCNGKCNKPHCDVEQHIWSVLSQNNKFVENFVNEDLDKPPPPTTVEGRRRTRRPSVPRKRREVGQTNMSLEHHKRYDKFLDKWKGRFLLVCQQCYDLEPKVVKEMEMDAAKDVKIFCMWCLGKSYLILHEASYSYNNKVVFNEYSRVRSRQYKRVEMCRKFDSCNKGDECKFAHSSLELDFWSLGDHEVLFTFIKYCNRKANPRRPTLDGTFHCNKCCLSFPDASEYHKYMNRPHEHFKDICRSKDCWIYSPLKEGSYALCQEKCPRKYICRDAHSIGEKKEWDERKKLEFERSKFLLRSKSDWYDLTALPEDIRNEKRVIVDVCDPERKLSLEDKSAKWSLKITTTDKSFKLKKIGFHGRCNFEIRRADESTFSSVIAISEMENPNHEFKVLYINPKKTYGEHVGKLICQFMSEIKLYFLDFRVYIEGSSNVTLPDRLSSNDWTEQREIIRYESSGKYMNSYDEKVQNVVRSQKRTHDAIVDMQGLTVKNYCDKMHKLMYAEEDARRKILSRLNMSCAIKMLTVMATGNMLGEFSIPMSVSTDEALLFKDSCHMILIGEPESDYAYESKILQFSTGEIYLQESVTVTIEISQSCCKDLILLPDKVFQLQVQFQLDSSMFCLRHHAIDNIKSKIAFVCPSQDKIAKLGQIGIRGQCQNLDETQDMVYNFLHLKKPENDKGKSFPPLVVAGPFGTGKTHTIKQVLINLLGKSVAKPVLICTLTNSAADLYLEDVGIASFGTSKILRLVYHGRNISSIPENARNFCLIGSNQMPRYPSMEELRKYKVVITTFRTAMVLSLEVGITGGMFGHIFLDEASQAMEADVIIPLLLADCENTRVIFAGDHRQTTERMYSDEKGQVKSILERLYEAYESDMKNCRIRLRNNYRCVKGILDLISKLFYKENALKCVSKVQCISGFQPVYLIHIQGQCIKSIYGDYLNESEAYQLSFEIDLLVNKQKAVKEKEILVVSAFRSQVEIIRKILRTIGLYGVSVQTVQNIQGQEFKVVMLSTVLRRTECLRSTGDNFGFLSDYRLLNVALTRAKSLVVVVGDTVTLCSIGKCEKHWKKFVKHCQDAETMLPKTVTVELIRSQISMAKQTLRATADEFVPGRSMQAIEMTNHADEEVTDDETADTSIDTDSMSISNDDDIESWCSEDDFEDKILDDMIKEKTGIDVSKVMIGTGNEGQEYLDYESDDADDEDGVPDQSKRHSRKRAIYPAYSFDQLEQMLRRDRDKYKRCRIKIINWYTAEASPIDEEDTKTPAVNAEKQDNLEDVENIANRSDDDSHDDTTYCLNNDDPVAHVSRRIAKQISKVIYIETRANVARTFNQDEVLVEIIEERQDPTRPFYFRRIGKVLGCLGPRQEKIENRRIICRPNEDDVLLMHPFDRKLTLFCILHQKTHSKNKQLVPIYKLTEKKRLDLELVGYEKVDEKKVYVVRYLKWQPHCLYPLGYVERSFDVSDFQQYLMLEYRVPLANKKAVIEEAERLDFPNYNEVSHIKVFTIDPQDAKDLDDAISLEKCDEHENCFKIGIHITDVASIVKEGTHIDKDAQRRFQTFYGPGDPIHMLPEHLSTEKCSILPNEIRPAITTTFHSSCSPYSPEYTPIIPERTLIKSTRQMSYEEAEHLYSAFHEGEILDSDDEYYGKIIYVIWQIMWEWRLQRISAEAFYKNPDNFQHILDGRAHLLIEEAMIATNKNSAEFLTSRDVLIPMRVQDAPEEGDWSLWDKVHINLIPNSCFLKSKKRYLKRCQRIHDGAPVDDSDDDDSSENEDDGVWEQVRRDRNRNRWDNRQQTESAGTIAPKQFTTIFKTYWKEMLDAKQKGDMESFIFIAACDDLHPSQITSVLGLRQIMRPAYFSLHAPFHFSLRIDKYAWSSSPMRRYNDILIQRCIHQILDDKEPSEKLKAAIKKVLASSDNRHKCFDDELTRATLAKDFEEEPVVFEACIEQITEEFLKISIPLTKFLKNRKTEIHFSCLMITNAGDGQEYQTGSTCLDSFPLGWRLRYYDYVNRFRHNNSPSAIVNVPIRQWQRFIHLLSKRPRMQDGQISRYNYDMIDAVDSLVEATEDNNLNEISDRLTGQTPNLPYPIFHKRDIQWNMGLGSPISVQITGATDRTRLPSPSIQLFSIAQDLDVCIQHMEDPINIFAKDAERRLGNVRNMSEYQTKWEPLVRMDAAHSAVKENSSITINGVGICKKEIEKSHGPALNVKDSDDIYCLRFRHEFCYERYIDFHPGDLLCLRLKGVPSVQKNKNSKAWKKLSIIGIKPHHTVVVHALVTSCNKREKAKSKDKREQEEEKDEIIEFKMLFGDVSKKYLGHNNWWTVEIIPLSFAHRSMQKSIHIVSAPNFRSDLVQSICLGTVVQSRVPWNKEIKAKWIDRRLARFKFDLNLQQRQQEQRAILFNFSLIQGPPGTGKSFLGAQIAAKFAYMNKDGGRRKKVLYVGPSNKSVDVAAKYLKDVIDLKVVRMYSRALEEKLYPNPLKPDQRSSQNEDDNKKPDEALELVSLHQLIRRRDDELTNHIRDFDTRVKRGCQFERKDMDRYNALINEAKQKELEDVDILICTCSASCAIADWLELQNEHGSLFGQCIIDECGMCSEPETIMPLATFQPDQIVLIGDHMQLRPVVTCNKAEKLGLGHSLFMRYKEMVGMLTNQYRMHKHIMDFPSKQFYNGQLTCDQTVLQRRSDRNDPFKSKSNKALFLNVKGRESITHFKTKDEGDQSKYNMEQVKTAAKLVHRLCSHGVPVAEIMVLSPYTAQCKKIRLELRKHGEIAKVHVGTVVTSQGSESEYVILSTVRAQPTSSIMHRPNIRWLRKHLGFLCDRNQINVALTRAKRRLFIIGDKELLGVDEMWKQLLKDYEKKGAILDDNFWIN